MSQDSKEDVNQESEGAVWTHTELWGPMLMKFYQNIVVSGAGFGVQELGGCQWQSTDLLTPLLFLPLAT